MHPFFTANPTDKGAALGFELNVWYGGKRHVGVITVDSIENEFTEVTVAIPLT